MLTGWLTNIVENKVDHTDNIKQIVDSGGGEIFVFVFNDSTTLAFSVFYNK